MCVEDRERRAVPSTAGSSAHSRKDAHILEDGGCFAIADDAEAVQCPGVALDFLPHLSVDHAIRTGDSTKGGWTNGGEIKDGEITDGTCKKGDEVMTADVKNKERTANSYRGVLLVWVVLTVADTRVVKSEMKIKSRCSHLHTRHRRHIRHTRHTERTRHTRHTRYLRPPFIARSERGFLGQHLDRAGRYQAPQRHLHRAGKLAHGDQMHQPPLPLPPPHVHVCMRRLA